MRLFSAVVLGILIALTGCSPADQATPKEKKGPATQSVGKGPISELDLPLVERQLLSEIRLASTKDRPLQIRQMAHSKRVSYVLYSLPNNDGLAVVTKQGPDIRILERYAIRPGDPQSNLVSYATILPGNPWDPDNGVLFGRVYNPYVKSIEAFFRDTTKFRADVTDSRGFIIVRPGTDPRFVQINAIGDGGLWWTKDTR